jgi:hypothetical protein
VSAELSALVIAVAFLWAGYGILWGAGALTPSPASFAGAAGLAYVLGLASTLMAGVLLICLGLPMNLPAFALVSFVVGSAGAGIGLGRSGWRSSLRWPVARPIAKACSVERVLVAFVCAILAVGAVLGYRSARVMPLADWDSWSIWARKGTILFDHGTLASSFFGSSSYAFMHPDYPLLLPILESIWFRLVGSADVQTLHVEFWVLLIASLGAAGYLVKPVTRSGILVLLVGFLALVPAVSAQLMTMYADIPMALLLLLGVVALGRWLVEGQRWLLVVATLCLAAAANTKNEGLTAAISALVVAVLISAIRPGPSGRRADLSSLLAAIGGFALAIAPWRLWLAAHHVTGDMPVGKGLNPSYLAGRVDRLSPTLTSLYGQLTDQQVWHYALPLAISLAVACLFVRFARRVAAFYLLTGLVIFLSLLWAYMINPNAIGWYLATSAGRTVDGMMFVAMAAILHLTGLLLSPAPPGTELPAAAASSPRSSTGGEPRPKFVDAAPAGAGITSD